MRRANARAEDVLKNLPTLETDRLILRQMILGDAEAVFAYASDPEVTRYVLWDTHHTIEDSETFLRSVAERYENAEAADWGIVYKGNGRFIGGCSIVGWDLENARAEMGYVLSRQYWGQGLMPEAVRAMIAFGFEKMGLNRLEVRCITENTASVRVMEKAGMLYEGTLRQREFIKGAYRDTKIYSILKSEFSRR
ncbi:MAG: GNAT family N-acetyltransferase [Actinomycetota bacterium]|nr:GNAT family N-acetyltransferase [Actinomycetota bacterium]